MAALKPLPNTFMIAFEIHQVCEEETFMVRTARAFVAVSRSNPLAGSAPTRDKVAVVAENGREFEGVRIRFQIGI